MIAPGLRSLIGLGSAAAVRNIHAGAGRLLGGAGRSMMYGAAAGGLYGATFGDSILGGMAGGAAMGLGMRYGRAGFRSASRYMGGKGVTYKGLGTAFTGAVGRRAARDWRAIKLRSNKGMNQIRSSMKGWTGGIAPLG